MSSFSVRFEVCERQRLQPVPGRAGAITQDRSGGVHGVAC